MRLWISAAAAMLVLAVPHTAAAGTIDRWAAHNHLTGAWRTKDKDRDGIKNRREFVLRTNPRRADTDRDGLHDGDELTVGTDPRNRDSDRDGIRDGDENAGVITAYDGTSIGIRRFHGKPLRADVLEDSICAGSDAQDGTVSGDAPDEEQPPSDDYVEVTEDSVTGDPHWAEGDDGQPSDSSAGDDTPAAGDTPTADDASAGDDEEPAVVDLGGDDDYGVTGCDDPRLKPGVTVTSAVVKNGVATEINLKS